MRNGQPVTEDHVSGRSDIDLRSTLDLVELINDEDARVSIAVRSASQTLAAAIDGIVERLERGGRLVYIGAGSSGRLALVDAVECGPTFGVPPEQVIALVAGGATALAVAQEAAEDDDAAGAADRRGGRCRGARCRRPAVRERRYPLRGRRCASCTRGRRAHCRRRLRPRVRAGPARRPRGRRRRRARGDRGLDEDEGRHGAEARAEHDLDRVDGADRQDLRQPDGRRRREQRKASQPRSQRRRDRHRCGRGGGRRCARVVGRRCEGRDRFAALRPRRGGRTDEARCGRRRREAGPRAGRSQ